MKKIIGVLIVGVLLFLGFRILKERQIEDLMAKKPKVYPLRVKAISLKEQNITITLPFLAEVRSGSNVFLASKFSGRVLKIAPLSKKVKKGEILVRIDDSDLRAKLSEVNSNIASTKALLGANRANLENLYEIHKRSAKLLKVKMVSIEHYKNEEIQINSLRAKIASERENLKSLIALKKSILNDLSYATLKAPFDGIVSEKFLNKDDLTMPGKRILKVSSNKRNYLFLSIDKRIKGVIFKDRFFKAKELGSAFNSLMGYRVDVDNNLIVGEKVKVLVVLFRGNGVLLPFDAVLSLNGKNYVLALKDNRVVVKEVHIIASGSEGIVIKEKIKRVIRANPDILLKIKAGYPIKVEDV
ncbi:MAG: efflux RND transporter periplasmic adaptor subunit [Nautiliaceae bacterium]